MPNKRGDSYDDRQANAVTLTCSKGCGTWHCTHRKKTCPHCGKPTLRRRREPKA